MKAFLKVIDKLKKQPQCRNPAESDLICKYNKGWNDALEQVRKLIATYVPSDMWIPTELILPEEPDEDSDIENLPQYTVTIKGAEYPTSLTYIGDGRWMDIGVGGEIEYPVSAWIPMPEAYKENENE